MLKKKFIDNRITQLCTPPYNNYFHIVCQATNVICMLYYIVKHAYYFSHFKARTMCMYSYNCYQIHLNPETIFHHPINILLSDQRKWLNYRPNIRGIPRRYISISFSITWSSFSIIFKYNAAFIEDFIERLHCKNSFAN